MVDLVLEDVSQPPLGRQLLLSTGPVLVAHADLAESRRLLPLVGDGQAPLLEAHRLALLHHHRVGDLEEGSVLPTDPGDRQGDPDLVGRDADPLRGPQRLHHLVEQRVERRPELGHRESPRGQELVGPDDDWLGHLPSGRLSTAAPASLHPGFARGAEALDSGGERPASMPTLSKRGRPTQMAVNPAAPQPAAAASSGAAAPAVAAAEAEFQPYVADDVRMKEFTPKAVLVGIFFGLLFGASTVYLALKAGLTVSASIPVAVLSISVL